MNKNLPLRNLLKLAGLIFIGLIISACGSEESQRVTLSPTEFSQKSKEVEEAKIYSLLLNEYPGNSLGTPVLIYQKTYFDGGISHAYAFQDAPLLDKETLINYEEVNQQTKILDLTLSLNEPYEYIDSGEFDWDRDHQKYPNSISITTFSQIGFNKEHDQALVDMEYYCGGECAAHNTYFLIFYKGAWRVVNILRGWIS